MAGQPSLSVYAAALAALVGGVLLVRRRQWEPVWLWLVPVVLFASVAPLTGSPRYRTAIDPFLLMLAAGAVVHLVARRQVEPVTTSMHRRRHAVPAWRRGRVPLVDRSEQAGHAEIVHAMPWAVAQRAVLAIASDRGLDDQ